MAAAAKPQHRCGDNKVKCETDEDIVIIVNGDDEDDKVKCESDEDIVIIVNGDDKDDKVKYKDKEDLVIVRKRNDDPIGVKECCLVGFLILFFNIIPTIVITLPARNVAGLPKFQIHSVLATPILNASSSSPAPKISNVDFNFTFSISQGHDYNTILYNFDTVSLFYNRVFLSGTTLVPLFQGPRQQSTVVPRFSVEPARVDERVVNAIVTDRWRRGVVELGMELEASVKIGPGRMKSNWRPRAMLVVRVACEGVKVVFSSNSSSFGTLDKGPKDCSFEIVVPS